MDPRHLSRRRFLALGGAAGTIALGASLGRLSRPLLTAAIAPTIKRDPFMLGVASGDPWPDSVVLWTRVVTNADDPTVEGVGRLPLEVEWQVAVDPAMARIERHGSVQALPEHAHSVHVIADGLRPGREYWYRFRHGRWLSPIGRTKTAPAPGTRVDRIDLAVASCQRWTAGYYTAHRHLAAEHADVVVFLGDYIYEYGIDGSEAGRADVADVPVPLAGEAGTLARYRAQYAWYKLDPDLQTAHRAAPWIATWDDHEVEDNYAGDVAASGMSRGMFAARRTAAYQAYWEHLPLRTGPPVGSAMSVHRRIGLGSLASIHVLDTRQHRSDQIAGDAWQRPGEARSADGRTMLGDRQQRWLSDGLASSTTTWNVVAQQVIASRLDVDTGDGLLLNADTWDGYPTAQRRLYDAVGAASNPVVLTGDLHAAYAFDVQATHGDPDAPAIAVELATTSISSGGDGSDLSDGGRRFLDANPHLRYANQRRGYLRCRITPDALTADFRVVPYVTGDAGAPISTGRSFVVEAGRPGLVDS